MNTIKTTDLRDANLSNAIKADKAAPRQLSLTEVASVSGGWEVCGSVSAGGTTVKICVGTEQHAK